MKFLDTNVIVRYLVEEKEKQPEDLEKFFLQLDNGNLNVELLDIVFLQVIFVLKSFYKIKKIEIIENLKRILFLNGIYMKNKKIMERTLEIWQIHSGDIVDCYIAAYMENSGDKEIFTYDKGIQNLGIKVIKP
ncbi:MAG: PIN domain-containing protein [Candidatus Omnitrophica bacterium]|jgi:predicted nucleic-acid-binding protein|nr:PIN domain-containing protein [Candidatus Omnitrophota bacterium]